MEDEDIERFFEDARRFIEAAAAAGGAALVHCHEGKSRSVTLVLAYLMRAQARSFLHAPSYTLYLSCVDTMLYHQFSFSRLSLLQPSWRAHGG